MKILIAEDEAFSRSMLQTQLESIGHEVVPTESGQEAWSRLQNEAISMVITDWMMPDLDGMELVRRIREREDSRYVYVIVLTVKSAKFDQVHGIRSGADDFLSKPYDREELDVRIRAGERVIKLEEKLHAKNRQLEDAMACVEAASKRMKSDLDAAAVIQRSLLPERLPNSDAIRVDWIYQPCDELAGDIFNVFQIDEQSIGFYMLDVVGHGVPAALLSVTLSRLLTPDPQAAIDNRNPRSLSYFRSPRNVAELLNSQFPMERNNEQYFTLFYGCLDLASRQLTFVSAGHPSPLVAPARGDTHIVYADGYPIGLVENPKYEDRYLQLNPGDRLMIYSDGLLDMQNPEGEQFGTEKLIDAMRERGESVHDGVEGLTREISDWQEGRASDDDISVLAIELPTAP